MLNFLEAVVNLVSTGITGFVGALANLLKF